MELGVSFPVKAVIFQENGLVSMDCFVDMLGMLRFHPLVLQDRSGLASLETKRRPMDVRIALKICHRRECSKVEDENLAIVSLIGMNVGPHLVARTVEERVKKFC